MRLTDRDILVLKTLDKLRVLNIETTAKLCGFTRYNKCADRMKILHEKGYLNYYQESINTKRYYYLSGKGINAVYPAEKRMSKHGKKYIHYREPAKFRKANLDHEIMIAHVLSYILEWNKELTIDDFQSDREMQTFSKNKERTFRHYCDLQCEKYRIKIEVELSRKERERTKRNISLNDSSYIQIWIAGNTPVYNMLVREKEDMPEFEIYIIRLEEFGLKKIIFSELYDNFIESHPSLLEELEEIRRLEMERQLQLNFDENSDSYDY